MLMRDQGWYVAKIFINFFLLAPFRGRLPMMGGSCLFCMINDGGAPPPSDPGLGNTVTSWDNFAEASVSVSVFVYEQVCRWKS